jgi:hypothetical protein
MQQLDVSQSSSAHRGYQEPDDHIYVFLNFKQVGKFKDKASANKFMQELISKGPKESQKDFIEYKDSIMA